MAVSGVADVACSLMRFNGKLRFYDGAESVIIVLLSANADGIQVFKGLSGKSSFFRDARVIWARQSMTAENSIVSDQQEQEKQSASEQGGFVINPGLPEEAQKILARLQERPDSDVMNSEALRLVRILWPKAFNVSQPRPLKIGIHREMADANVLPPHIIPVALRFFTSMERYLEEIRSGATRINLQGKPAGRVKLREAVDAEIKLYVHSSDFVPSRSSVLIGKVRVIAVNGQQRAPT